MHHLRTGTTSVDQDHASSGTSTLGLRIAAVFIVVTVSLCGCLIAVILGKKGQDGGLTNRLLKCTAAGVIACVGFVHILPDSAEMLSRVTSYPLAYVVAMMGAFLLLAMNQVLDYVFIRIRSRAAVAGMKTGLLATTSHRLEDSPVLVDHHGNTHSFTQYQACQDGQSGLDGIQDTCHPYQPHNRDEKDEPAAFADEDEEEEHGGHHHCHHHAEAAVIMHSFKRQPFLLAYVMEVGIIFHSVIIGVGLGVVTDSIHTVQTLLVAICFHQFFEGAGLSACIVEADLGQSKTAMMISLFSITTSLGIALGIAISSAYDPTSLASCLVQGIVNALASGILIYLTLVDLVAEEFSKKEVRGNVTLQLQMFGGSIHGGRDYECDCHLGLMRRRTDTAGDD